MVIAVLYVLLLNMLDTTVKSAEDIEKEFNIPVIASIPVYAGTQSQKKKGGKK